MSYEVRKTLFWAATTHDPNKEPPDWNTQRALNLMEERRKIDARSWWPKAASDALTEWLLFDPAPVKETIRRAHQGDMVAMRRMAKNYLTAEDGFPWQENVAVIWLENAAYRGDAVSMAALAIDDYNVSRDLDRDACGWGWTVLAQEYGDGRVREVGVWLQEQLEARMQPQTTEKARQLLEEYRRLMRSLAEEQSEVR